MNNKITAIIFDWAGTIIDQGSCGPIHAVSEQAPTSLNLMVLQTKWQIKI